jgi:hypothetical protein
VIKGTGEGVDGSLVNTKPDVFKAKWREVFGNTVFTRAGGKKAIQAILVTAWTSSSSTITKCDWAW